MNRLNQLKTTTPLFLIALALASFALLPKAQGVSPAPDGGYGGFNTAEGTGALLSLTTGIWNTANGGYALANDTSGGTNTATGTNALRFNVTGSGNTANGVFALYENTTSFNTAIGYQALFQNTTGSDNAAVGDFALFSNTINGAQTAVGNYALFHNTTGDSNNATGFEALRNNTTGVWNEAYGFDALFDNVTGRENTAIGDSAGLNVTGSFNINIGSAVSSLAGENNTIRIGDNLPRGGLTSAACFIGGISGVTLASGVPVVVDTNGQLGIAAASSQRFKDEIKPMDKASEAILALKPVTFHYKKEIDRNGIPQFGLVAEEVEKVNPDLVTHDAKGELYTVRYDAVNAMLLNEFLKEHRQVAELKKDFQATVAQQQKEIQALTARLKEQAAQIQNVSARFEMSKPTPQTVANNQ